MLRDFWNQRKTNAVDPLIDRVMDDMHTKGPEANEYPTLLSHLERLYQLKFSDKREPININNLITVGGTFVCVCVMVAYEHKHVFTTKALTLLPGRR